MTLNYPTLELIDARVNAAQERITAAGTMTTRISATRAMVTFDGSAVAVPVKMGSNVSAEEGDRVGMVKFGTDWVVITAFVAIERNPRPSYKRQTVVTTAMAPIIFADIPSTLQAIEVTFSAKATSVTALESLLMRVNNDTGNVYYHVYTETANATVGGGNAAAQGWNTIAVLPSNAVNSFSVGKLVMAGWNQAVANYDRITWNCTSGSYRTSADSRSQNFSGVAITNPPWTELRFAPANNNFGVGTTFTLLGWD